METLGSVVGAFGVLYGFLRKGWRVDERGLAVGRVLVAAVLLGDLANRARWMTAHYTDAGVMPREMLFLYFFHEQWFSLHAIGGGIAVQAALFCIHAAFAAAMLVGYHTPTATMATWIFTCSLQSRNLLVSHGGDVLLRMLLFFLMFLPTANRYSIDAVIVKMKKLRQCQRGVTPPEEHQRTKRRERTTVADLRSLSLILQMCTMYFWNFIHKNGHTWRVEGNAAFFALQLDYFRTWIGDVILAVTPQWVYPFFTWSVLIIEAVGWLLLLSPVLPERSRLLGSLLLISMHVAFGSCLAIGMFGFITISGCIALLPSLFWDTLGDVVALTLAFGPLEAVKRFTRLRTEDITDLLEKKSITLYYDESYTASCLLACIVTVFVDRRVVRVRPASLFRPVTVTEEDDDDIKHATERIAKEERGGLLLRSMQEETIATPKRGGGMGLGGFLAVDRGERELQGKHAMKRVLESTLLGYILSPISGLRLRMARALVRRMEESNRKEKPDERETMLQRKKIAEEYARRSREALADVWKDYANANIVLSVVQEAGEQLAENLEWKKVHKFLWGLLTISCILWANLWCLAHYNDHAFFPPAYSTGVWLRLDQQWMMFAPDPPQASHYYLIPGHLRNGTVVELFRNRGLFQWTGTPFSDRSRGAAAQYRANVGSHRWAKFYENLNNHEHEDLIRERFLHYVCEQWNERHSGQTELLTVALEYYLVAQSVDGSRKPPKRVPLATVRCDGSSLGVTL